jgi:hypothetical protein
MDGSEQNFWTRIKDSTPRSLILALLLGWLFGANSLAVMGQEKSTTRQDSTEDTQLRDITGIEEQPHPLARAWWPVILSVAAVLITSLFLVTWRLYRQNSNQPEMLPGPWALNELSRLESQIASGNRDELNRFPTMLSEVFRLYLERRFRLRAPKQTTPEFLRDVQDSNQIPASHRELLKDFLERCDLGKFAQIQFTQEECQALAQAARTFVEQTAE